MRHFLAIALALLTSVASAQDRNTRFGMPKPKVDPAARDSHLVQRPQYTLSYNDTTKAPNWVAWQLKQSDLGKAVWSGFQPDPLLPAGFVRVVPTVYTSSGFDRGHMCPSADRADSEANNDPTFFTTNIVPQSPACNQKAWARLEDYSRGLVKNGDHVLQIVCGPYGTGGEGKDGAADSIGKGKVKVNVPSKVWKVILVLPDDKADPRKNTRAIAVIMPNDQSVDQDWARYRVSVAEVEKLTRMTFFPEIAAETRAAIIRDADDVKVKAPKKK